ncbi:MAG: hemolysin family protein [Rhodospirillales bacterium]
MDNKDDPAAPSETANGSTPPRSSGAKADTAIGHGVRGILRSLGWLRNGDSPTRDALDTLMNAGEEGDAALDADERTLVGNILSLRNRSAEDVMVPRVDIVAIGADAGLTAVIDLMIESGHSRLPVYRETLDDAIGMVHIKDILAWKGENEAFQLAKIVRPVLFVAPSMEVLQLLLEMRATRSHMALVVDEFGGVDGLITIEDVVEEIVGEIADEHDREVVPGVLSRPDGSIDADARAPLEILEQHFGPTLSEDEQEDIDTLGGLVVSLAGRVPEKAETIEHPSGLAFEVLDADPRRIKRVRVSRADSAPPAAAGRA